MMHGSDAYGFATVIYLPASRPALAPVFRSTHWRIHPIAESWPSVPCRRKTPHREDNPLGGECWPPPVRRFVANAAMMCMSLYIINWWGILHVGQTVTYGELSAFILACAQMLLIRASQWIWFFAFNLYYIFSVSIWTMYKINPVYRNSNRGVTIRNIATVSVWDSVHWCSGHWDSAIGIKLSA